MDYSRTTQEFHRQQRISSDTQLSTLNQQSHLINRCFPCSIKPKSVRESPLLMASILVFDNYMQHRYTQKQNKCNNEQMSIRNYKPSSIKQSRVQTSRVTKRIDDQQLLFCGTQPILFESNRQSAWGVRKPSVWSNGHDVPDSPQKWKCNSPIKAQLYFSPNLREAIRAPKQHISIPQFMAQKQKQLNVQ